MKHDKDAVHVSCIDWRFWLARLSTRCSGQKTILASHRWAVPARWAQGAQASDQLQDVTHAFHALHLCQIHFWDPPTGAPRAYAKLLVAPTGFGTH